MQAHIHLDETLGAKYAILPGDPARLDKLIPFLDDYREETFNREYRSITGYYKGIKILGMSTGMGGVSTAIGVEELKNIGVTTLIRIGSCGTLVPGIDVGDLVISSGCVRDDGTSHAYIRATYPAVPDTQLLFAIIEAAKENGCPHHIGVTRSHETFYSEAEIAQEEYWMQQNVLCDDMETAPLFVVGRLRGMKCASILNNVVAFAGDKEESVGSYSMGGESPAMVGERNEIMVALEAIAKMEGK
ncbi:MAG: nucleoside phosphorylase [Firmicutes bacterium]|nr:nucleoside phosphorylase [Bacillota bacterium]